MGIIGAELGPGSISLMIDDADQLPAIEVFKTEAGFPAQIFVKIDTGYRRAGITTDCVRDESKPPSTLEKLLRQIASLAEKGAASLAGFYSHSGHSYHEKNEIDVMQMLIEELRRSEPALEMARAIFPYDRFTLSVGATPTTTSVQNILFPSIYAFSENQVAREMKHRIGEFRQYGDLELHAGVYPLLDEQQLSTHARPDHEADDPSQSLLSHKKIALTVLTEVCSLYNHRKHPEALIAAGSLALGREPCPSYRGWGVVSNWGMGKDSDLEPSGLIIDRISQEHGILAREDREKPQHPLELRVGQKVRIFPNHACIAGAGYGWYFIVDSARENKNEIIDVWVRWRGW
jgi:D-serine ammonia-lyase